MRLEFTKLLVILLVTMGVSSCVQDDNEYYPSYQDEIRSQTESTPNEDPFSLDVMQEAYNYVTGVQTRSSVDRSPNIQPTHRYIRFAPSNKEQIDALNDKFSIFNFPLDEKITTGKNEIIDSYDIANKDYFYSVVEYDAELPDSISYCELSAIYDPYCTDLEIEQANDIINTAYAISKYGDATRANDITPWIPSGTIKVWDDIASDYVPVEGLVVKVKNSSSPTYRSFVTDENGYFRATISFVEDVVYLIEWKNAGEWVIKFGDTIPAVTVSSSIRTALNLNISPSSKGTYYAATSYRGASHYWNYADLLGFTAPDMGRPIRIHCYDSESSPTQHYTGVFWADDSRPETLPDIEVYCKNRSTIYIIGTTFHELAHVVHYIAVGQSRFNNINLSQKIIKESWAEFIECYLIDDYYTYLSTLTGVDYTYIVHNGVYTWCDEYFCYTTYTPDIWNRQSWTYSPDPEFHAYTPLIIDLRDAFNQKSWYNERGFSTTYVPDDNVLISDNAVIEELVFTTGTIIGLKNALIDYVENTPNLNFTVLDVETLFDIYELINNN